MAVTFLSSTTYSLTYSFYHVLSHIPLFLLLIMNLPYEHLYLGIKLVEKLYRVSFGCKSVGHSFIDRYGHKYTFMLLLLLFVFLFFCLFFFFVKDKKKFNKVNKNNL